MKKGSDLLKNKAKNCPNTTNDTVKNKSLEPFCTTNCIKSTFYKNRNTWNPPSITVCRIREIFTFKSFF